MKARMQNFRCLIAYTGTAFYGFKATKMGRNIEDTLKNSLEKILRHPVKIQAASLTDRGVHAEGQVINFFSDCTLDPGRLLCSLRSLLPRAIAPLELTVAPSSFHPTLDALGKAYHYLICNRPTQLPFHQEYSWHCPLPLDLSKMQEAIPLMIGKRDFSAFANEQYKDPMRNLTQIALIPLEHKRLRIEIEGDRFLYKMARNLVGTLVAIGREKIKKEELPYIFESRDRRLAAMTAPAHGLTLKKVYY